MKVRIKNDIEKPARGVLFPYTGGDFTFSKGEEITIRIINDPGKYHPGLPGNQYSNCDFWVFENAILHLIFLADEIDALILMAGHRLTLDNAPVRLS